MLALCSGVPIGCPSPPKGVLLACRFTAGAVEDREMACSAQLGLASYANKVFTFGLFEGAIRHFHRNLGAAIET